MKRKRILTIQDYSCLGRCSLTEALPVISACGIECVGVPTSILSNHTQFPSWTYRDLGDDLLPIVEKWEKKDRRFDALYTGYLGEGQVDLILNIRKKLSPDTLLFVDPAMADNGSLYAGFTPFHIEEMRKLVGESDLCKPNLTEAALLTNTPYEAVKHGGLDTSLDLAKKLVDLGAKKVVLSGLSLKPGEIGVLFYQKDETYSYFQKPLKAGIYHGTGDLFSSVLVSAWVKGWSILKAAELAHDFVSESIEATLRNGTDGLRYGTDFEEALPSLIKLMEKAG